MITTEQKTDLLFLLLIAETANGLSREYNKLVKGDRYLSTFVETKEKYCADQFDKFWWRQGIRDARREAARSGL
jgi:hypothetical protein